MTTPLTLFGTDLRLLGDLERQNSRSGGSDLVVADRAGGAGSARVDLQTLAGVPNLQQALLLRLLTAQGELASLGHESYGSRLHELIGELNSETNRLRAKVFVLQALGAEPRVREVLGVTVKPNANDRTRIDVDVKLLAVDAPSPVNLVFSFDLSGGAAP